MRPFTFTDAARKPRRGRDGAYIRQDIVGYNQPCKIICPDGSEIHEDAYLGYGLFGSPDDELDVDWIQLILKEDAYSVYGFFGCQDIYELVVDWNKPFLKEIFEKKKELICTACRANNIYSHWIWYERAHEHNRTGCRTELLELPPSCWSEHHLSCVLDSGCHAIEKLAVAYQHDDPALPELIQEAATCYPFLAFLEKQWKRNIGIAIACDNRIHKQIPYPIKVTCSEETRPYEDWEISLSVNQ